MAGSPDKVENPTIPDNLDATIALNAFYAVSLSCAFLVIFLIFRRKLKWVYRPNTAPFAEIHPILPEPRRGSWAWIKYTLFVPDIHLLTLVGMDAFILIMILKMLFWIFLILSVVASLLLFPIYMHGTYGAKTSLTTQIYSRLSIAHVETGSPWLWVSAIAVWLFTFIFGYILILFYSAYVHLRQAYIASPASLTSVLDLIAFYRVTGSLEKTYALLDIPSRTVLVHGLDASRFTCEEAVTAFFDQCSVGMVMESVFIKDHPKLRMLIRDRNNTLRRLESACMLFSHIILQVAKKRLVDPSFAIPPSFEKDQILSHLQNLLPENNKIAISVNNKKTDTIELGSSAINPNLPQLAPLTTTRKRKLLDIAFDRDFLPELRPRIRKPWYTRMMDSIISSRQRSVDLEQGASTSTCTWDDDMIASLSAKLVALDSLIEEERLAIFNESRSIISENSKEMNQQEAQAATLNLPKETLLNDTRLLLVQASSTPPTSTSDVQQKNPLPVVTNSGGDYHQSAQAPDSSSEKSTAPFYSAQELHHVPRGLASDNAIFFSSSLAKEAIVDARLAFSGHARTAFVTFREAVSASIVSQCLIDDTPFSCRTSLAPRPNEIIWGNITLPAFLRSIRLWSAFGALIMLNLFWFIPVTFVNSLNQINRIAQVIPILHWVLKLPRTIQTLIEGLLAPLLLNGLLVIVPFALQVLARYEGASSKSDLQRSLMRKYLAFLYLQTFFVSFLSGSITAALIPFLEGNFSSVLEEIRQMLVPKSSFFFNLIAIKVANDLFLSLANPVGLLFYLSLTTLTGSNRSKQHPASSSKPPKTPRERHEGRAPERLNYGIIVPILLFSVPLIMTYAVISPLMLIIGAVYYGFATLIYRYRMLYAARSTWESGGSFLYDAIGFMCVGLATFQAMTAIQLSFQGARLPALVVLPSMIGTLILWQLIRRVTKTASSYVPAGARPDLAAAAPYPAYKRTIPRLHARDAMAIGSALGGRSTLDLVAVLTSRQKRFLAEVEVSPYGGGSGDQEDHQTFVSATTESTSSNICSTGDEEGLLRPTASTEAVMLTKNKPTVTLPSDELKKNPSLSSNESDEFSLKETVEWYMSNPYRNPTLFKRLNSIYLPRIFFKIVQIISQDVSETCLQDHAEGEEFQPDYDDSSDDEAERQEANNLKYTPSSSDTGGGSGGGGLASSTDINVSAHSDDTTRHDGTNMELETESLDTKSGNQLFGRRFPRSSMPLTAKPSTGEGNTVERGVPEVVTITSESGPSSPLAFMRNSSPRPPPIIKLPHEHHPS